MFVFPVGMPQTKKPALFEFFYESFAIDPQTGISSALVLVLW